MEVQIVNIQNFSICTIQPCNCSVKGLVTVYKGIGWWCTIKPDVQSQLGVRDQIWFTDYHCPIWGWKQVWQDSVGSWKAKAGVKFLIIETQKEGIVAGGSESWKWQDKRLVAEGRTMSGILLLVKLTEGFSLWYIALWKICQNLVQGNAQDKGHANIRMEPGIVAHTCNPRIQETEAGRFSWVQGHPSIHNDF